LTLIDFVIDFEWAGGCPTCAIQVAYYCLLHWRS